MTNFGSNTYLFGANAHFLEEMYARYLRSPDALDKSWRDYFSSLHDDKVELEKFLNNLAYKKTVANPLRGDFSYFKEDDQPPVKAVDSKAKSSEVCKTEPGAVKQQSQNLSGEGYAAEVYRKYGHTAVALDPLLLAKPQIVDDLIDVDTSGVDTARLKAIYSGRIGYEFMHLESKAERQWFIDYLEKDSGAISIPKDVKLDALKDLLEITMFEEYLHVKFPGAKRFSIEGGEASLAAVEYIIKKSTGLGIKEVVVGMAHRGRLNTLTKIMKKPYHVLFSEFSGNFAFPENYPGDVKYHLGASVDRVIDGSTVHLSLTPNPSHLEAVNPVVLGRVRAKQDDLDDKNREKVLGLLVHGDAALAGQGSVAEALTLSQLAAYKTGGTIHIVPNNQIGFTTNPSNSRSSRYCTDIAKSIGAPILHVNGDDVEAVLYASQLVLEYKTKFQKDIFIDVVCYRKYGHNEGDEPFFTQPIMYNAIAKHKTPPVLYNEKLVTEGLIGEDYISQLHNTFKAFLDKEFEISKTYKPEKFDWLDGVWQSYVPKEDKNAKDLATGVDGQKLKVLGYRLSSIPENFNLNSKIARQLDHRRKMIESGEGIDWGTGEALAFATLLDEGFSIRMTGQDVERGTFSHRHAALTDQETENKFIQLNNLRDDQIAKIEICNSDLSELAVLGFEYGYSLSAPQKLVLWEAQFGDFVNGAQVLIDQFIVAAEAKWLRMSGIVLMLPHGYEGHGPEHSSARLERFLQLCAHDNIQVANCTTPASLFHILRRQQHRNYRKPLVLMTPKSLLRHKFAVSKLSEMSTGNQFLPVIPEIDKGLVAENIKKVVLCSGKVYYDLYEKRAELNVKDVVLIRIEQLYPFPTLEVQNELKKYKNAEIIWCQEEHENMGAHRFVKDLIILDNKKLKYVGRKESPSTAAGYGKLHSEELNAIMEGIYS